jgi:hypothetical protein
MKGGSIASDSVIGNLDAKVFDKLNAMFDNKVGGGWMQKKKSKNGKKVKAKTGGGCGCSEKKSGGSAFGSMMGSTMEAFQGNVRAMPHEMFTGPNAAVVSSATSAANTAKKVANAGVKVPNAGVKAPNAGMKLPNAGMKAPNASVKPPNAGVKAPNAGVKAPNAGMMSTNSTKPMMSTNSTNAKLTGGSCRKIGGSSQKFPTAAYSGEGGRRCTKCGRGGGSDMPSKIHHRGGNQSSSIPVYASNTSIANANAGQTMSQLMANSSGIRIKNKKLHGGKEIAIGPNLNIWDVPVNPKPQFNSSATNVLATEGVTTSPQIQKFMNYGTPSDKFPQSFSYGQAAGYKKKAKKVKKVIKKRRAAA